MKPAEPEKKKKKYSLWDFTKFTLPFLFKGTLFIKIQTLLTFLMLFLSKGLSSGNPLLLKMAVDNIQVCFFDTVSSKCEDESKTIIFVILYVAIRFAGDLVNNLREIPFANVSASAEIYISHRVYTHIQNQSLAFHLTRETGKVIRTVSRGSQSFATILRTIFF